MCFNRLFLFLLLMGCRHVKKPLAINTLPVSIIIQPYENVSHQHIEYVAAKLKRYNKNVIINPAVNLPAAAFYKPRNRYRADSIIRLLSAVTAKNNVTIGITAKDISTAKDTHEDWGIMGLGYCPGKACVISSYRLKKDKNNSLFKVAIHELGHTQGLPHCPVANCFMRDAEGGNPLDEETEFCKSCTGFLQQKGWTVN